MAQPAGLEAFAAAVRQQLGNPQRLVRSFDVGGSGVKTGLLAAPALRRFLRDGEDASPEEEQLSWLQPPLSLGEAPGERGFAAWLAQQLPSLQQEVADENVCFGVSVGGDVDHRSGELRNWWPAGGHPKQWEGADPLVADLMGLPPDRTFVLHDGEAHLLGCSRRLLPPSNLACLALGTGVGLGLSDGDGAVVDSSTRKGRRSCSLRGVPLSGARYRGTWRQWVQQAKNQDRVEEVLQRPFANVVAEPWRMPWVSLVLGRRGMELAEAAFDCPAPNAGDEEERRPAVAAYGEQWLHFLRTEFRPAFPSVQTLCFAGGVAEQNWPFLLPQLQKAPLPLLPPAPRGSALIGAGLYALAGVGGAAQGVWAP